MDKYLTVYKNEMNSICFSKFTPLEMDLFFTICSKIRDKGLETVRFPFADLKKLSNYKDKHKKRFIKDLDNTYSKMMNLIWRQGDDFNYKKFVLFTEFEMNGTEEYVDITINPKFSYLLNQISAGFTKFELEEFTSIRSSYAKTMFRLLKQFRLTGYYKVSLDEFRRLLDIPESYEMKVISSRVLAPIEKELGVYFKHLQINKIKKQKKIEYLEFIFQPQDDLKADGTKVFKNQAGKYYKNDIEHFTKEEVEKSFPQ